MDEERLQLGGEEKRLRLSRVVQGLLAEAIASQEQLMLPAVPERKGEHAFETVEAGRPFVLVGVQDDLGVGARREDVIPPTELVAKFVSVIDFAVSNEMARSVFVGQRLLTRQEVDYPETPRGESDTAVTPRAPLVGSAVSQRLTHQLQHASRPLWLAAELEDSSETTHLVCGARLRHGGVGRQAKQAAVGSA